jgi:hypothetical protein
MGIHTSSTFTVFDVRIEKILQQCEEKVNSKIKKTSLKDLPTYLAALNFQRRHSISQIRNAMAKIVDSKCKLPYETKFETLARRYDRYDYGNSHTSGMSILGKFKVANLDHKTTFIMHSGFSASRNLCVFNAQHAHCKQRDCYLYVLDTNVDIWETKQGADNKIMVGMRVVILKPMCCLGIVVRIAQGNDIDIAEVELDWQLQDGEPSIMYTPITNLRRFYQASSVCFKFANANIAKNALSALQFVDCDGHTESQSYSDIMSQVALSNRVWLKVESQRWIMATDDDRMGSILYSPSDNMLQVVKPLWWGPAICEDGAKVRVLSIPKAEAASRVAEMREAAVELSTNFRKSVDVLCRYPSVLQMAWEHANGVPLKPLTKQEIQKKRRGERC